MPEGGGGAGMVGMDHERGPAHVGDAQGARPGLLEIGAKLALDVGQVAGAREQRL